MKIQSYSSLNFLATPDKEINLLYGTAFLGELNSFQILKHFFFFQSGVVAEFIYRYQFLP